MAKIHGNRGALYVGLASAAAAASPVVNLTNWTIAAETDKVEVTAMGDTNKNYVAGLPDAQGTYSGFYDDSSAQLYLAASDGIARRFYLYPDKSTATRYWFGTGFFDESTAGGVSEAVGISGNWAAATSVIAVGIT